MRLSTPQRELIRAIGDQPKEQPFQEIPPGFKLATIEVLKIKDIVEWRDSYPDRTKSGWYLTERGQKAYDAIMASGDGPEALKEMFRI